MIREPVIIGSWSIFYDRPDTSLSTADLRIVYADILGFPNTITGKLTADGTLGKVERRLAIVPGNEYAYIYLGNLLEYLRQNQLADLFEISEGETDVTRIAFISTLTDVLVSQAKLRYIISPDTLPNAPRSNFSAETDVSLFKTGFLWLETRLKLYSLGLLMWDAASQQFYGYAEFDQIYAKVYKAQTKFESEEAADIAEELVTFGVDDRADTTNALEQNTLRKTADFMSQLGQFVTRWQEELLQEQEQLTTEQISEAADVALRVLTAAANLDDDEQDIVSRILRNAAHLNINLNGPLNLLQKVRLSRLPVFAMLRRKPGGTSNNSAAA